MLRELFTIVLILVALSLNGQKKDSFRYSDSLTYGLYSEKRWDELIKEGQRALKNGYDFYYMRMRIGIACYEKHNYAMASFQFRKALYFNNNDQIALEYLYYSYYLSGRTYQAMAILPSLYPQNRERVLKESRIRKNSLTIESFFSDTGSDYILSDPGSYFSSPGPGSQVVSTYFVNNALYASHILGNHFSYSHAYTNLLKENYLHYFDGTYEANLDPQRILQNQYWGSFNFFTSTGWTFNPSFHLITTRYPYLSVVSSGMNPSVRTFNLRTNGYYAGLNISKSIGYALLATETGYTHFSTIQRIHGAFSIVLYPAGNPAFYFGGKLSAGKVISAESPELEFAEGLIAGFSISGKVFFEFTGLTGKLNYYADNNGLYIYNSPDVLKHKFSAIISVPFNKAGLTVFAGGGISSYSTTFIPESGQATDNINIINYNSNNFTGGISWNF